MFMRFALKAVIMTVIIFGGVNYAAYLHTGKSIFPMWAGKIMAMFKGVKEHASRPLDSITAAGAGDAADQIFYKWTDADDVLQYTNVPPPEGISAEIIKVDPNSNLMQAVQAPEEEPEQVAAVTPSDKEMPEGPDMPFPYSPEQIKKTMDDARKAQQMMNEKMERQQQILDNL